MKQLVLVIIFFLGLSKPSATQAYPVYKNLVLEGGGIRGIAYAGALQVLEAHRITDSIKRVAGTSVGAIVATLISVGYTAKELQTILNDLRIQDFNDGHYIFFGRFNRMSRNYGWYRGHKLEDWIGKLIAAKTGNANITFRQLHDLSINNKRYKDVYITATNLSKQCCTVFDHTHYPDMQVKTAVRASISIPLYFGAVYLDNAGNKVPGNSTGNYDVFVDGGVVANYPIAIFDGIPEAGNTLGLKLDRPEQLNTASGIAPYPIHSFRNYIGALYNITIETLNRDSSEKQRTINISTGNIQPRVRKISTADKDILYNNGIAATQAFLSAK